MFSESNGSMEWHASKARQAGVDVACFDDPAAQIEISPLFASDAGQLKSNLSPDWKPEPPVVLR